MRIAVGLAAGALVLAGCAAGTSIKSLDEVDVESWRADIVAWPSAPSDPDMANAYQDAVNDCDGTVDDLAINGRPHHRSHPAPGRDQLCVSGAAAQGD